MSNNRYEALKDRMLIVGKVIITLASVSVLIMGAASGCTEGKRDGVVLNQGTVTKRETLPNGYVELTVTLVDDKGKMATASTNPERKCVVGATWPACTDQFQK